MSEISVPEAVTNFKRKLEVINLPKVYLLMNSALDKEVKGSLIEIFKNGLPDSYVEYEHIKYIFVDLLENPTFLVKRRAWGADYIRSFRERLKRGEEIVEEDTPQEVNAVVSLANEIKIADEVEKILEKDEAQGFARDKGFESIEVVKPLMGFIDKKTDKKYMVYPFVNGVSWSSFDPEIYGMEAYPVQSLIDIIIKNGINPSDLVGRQIMIDDTKMLLIDMEGYNFRRKSVEDSD